MIIKQYIDTSNATNMNVNFNPDTIDLYQDNVHYSFNLKLNEKILYELERAFNILYYSNGYPSKIIAPINDIALFFSKFDVKNKIELFLNE